MRSIAFLSVLAALTTLPVASQPVAEVAAAFGQSAQPRTLRQAAADAERAVRAARARSAALAAQARRADGRTDRERRRLAALAARIEGSEAAIAAADARIAAFVHQRRRIDATLASRRQPLVRLTGALQRLTATPPALAILQPLSLKEVVYVRAVLDGAVPHIRAQTAGLRTDLARSQELARAARDARLQLGCETQTLAADRARLVAAIAQNRRASRTARVAAALEARRAEQVAGQARTLDDLVAGMDAVAQLRAELAALPGPVLRPANGQRVAQASAPPAANGTGVARASTLADYRLPVAGQVIAGFREAGESGLRQSGVTIAPRAGAQIVAPAAGRIVFAGPYRGYGTIVIIEHDSRWTSLITGLGTLDVAVGDRVAANGPLGLAGRDAPRITIETRRDGKPVNPLNLSAAD